MVAVAGMYLYLYSVMYIEILLVSVLVGGQSERGLRVKNPLVRVGPNNIMSKKMGTGRDGNKKTLQLRMLKVATCAYKSRDESLHPHPYIHTSDMLLSSMDGLGGGGLHDPTILKTNNVAHLLSRQAHRPGRWPFFFLFFSYLWCIVEYHTLVLSQPRLFCICLDQA